MKKMAVIAVIAAIAVMNLWLMGLDFILCLVLAGFGFAAAAFGDITSEKKAPKQTISMTKAARQQREMVKA